MKSEYTNPIGQRVVDVEFGYKIYDSDDKDFVVNIVGGNDSKGKYIYLDKDAFDNGSDEICYLPTGMLVRFEKEFKKITYESRSWDECKERMKNLYKTFNEFSGKFLKETFKTWDGFCLGYKIEI